jgi:hypothetical protein
MSNSGVHVRIYRLLVSLAVMVMVITGCGSGPDSPAGTATTARALAPNGVEKLSAAGIVAKARQAAVHASAVRVMGDITDEGQRIKFDMQLLADRGGTGTLTVRGGSVRITRIGQRVYLKGSTAFWTAVGGTAAAQLFAGKWLKTSTSEPDTASLVSFTDIDALMTGLFKDTRNNALRKGREQRTGGYRAITVTMTGADGGTLFVALDGKPYPLRIEALPGAKEPGTVEFLDYNQPFTLKAPPPSQTIDFSDFRSG